MARSGSGGPSAPSSEAPAADAGSASEREATMPEPTPPPAPRRFTVRVVPRSSRNAVLAMADRTLKARITAPPVEGAANAALIRLLAKTLGVPAARITILQGERSREKTLWVEDFTPEELLSRLDR